MAENRTLVAIRRALTGLPGVNAVIEQQAGLIVKLWQAAREMGESVEDVASALAIAALEVKEKERQGDYKPCHLTVLAAARILGLRQSGSSFKRCGRSALADSFSDEGFEFEQACFDDPAAILEACEAVSALDPILVSGHMATAESEALGSSVLARCAGITTRAARYRKAKARAAAASGQGDLFGGLA